MILTHEEQPTYWARIYAGGPIEEAKRLLRENAKLREAVRRGTRTVPQDAGRRAAPGLTCDDGTEPTPDDIDELDGVRTW